MKPGNLQKQGAKSGGETKDEEQDLTIFAPPAGGAFSITDGQEEI